jgi:hypothetical protein
MTVFELRNAQTRIKFDGPSMAACLGISHDQYRRYYYGHAEIPSQVARAVLELEQIQKTFDVQRDAEYCEYLNKKYPSGIGERVRLEPEAIN